MSCVCTWLYGNTTVDVREIMADRFLFGAGPCRYPARIECWIGPHSSADLSSMSRRWTWLSDIYEGNYHPSSVEK